MPLSRYFRFRLRTLLVTAAVASMPLGWLAHSMHWIRQRHAMIQNGTAWCIWEGQSDPYTLAPAELRIFGEEYGYSPLLCFERDAKEVKRWFPEALVISEKAPDQLRFHWRPPQPERQH